MIEPLLSSIARSWRTNDGAGEMPSTPWVSVPAVPSSILRAADWPWWRRRLNRPPEAARLRIEAWAALHKQLNSHHRSPVPDWPAPVGEGIFGDSIIRVDFLDSFQSDVPLEVEGRVWDGHHLRRVVEVCPDGRLTVRINIASFDFDIVEIDGIGASKSSGRFFPTVHEFGKDFAVYKRAEADREGLARMLAHSEVRIVRRSGSDSVGLRLWDGRLFLCNAGGSHHFAAAAYITKSIGAKVPLNAALEIRTLNEASVNWLLAKFIPLAVATRDSYGLLAPVAKLLGACYELKVPGILCQDAKLLLIPANEAASADVVNIFYAAGFHGLTPWFQSLLTLQARYRDECVQRFGERLQLPDAVDVASR